MALEQIAKPWLFLAPMAGYADWAFRELCYGLGAEVTVSHLMPAEGFAGRPRRLLAAFGRCHGERPFFVQLYGKYPEHFQRAARALTDALPLAGIDINMGCPAQRVVGSSHGSALLREPERAAAIVAAARAGTHLPVSVKIRGGWDSCVAPEFARLLEEAGASLLTIHGRTREQQYRGRVDLAMIAATKRAVGIPVVGNGDVVDVATARAMLATGVDGIMVGRGAIGNPGLFAELRAALKGEPRYLGGHEVSVELIRRHARLAWQEGGDRAFRDLRKHLIAYARGSLAAAQLRKGVERVSSWPALEEWLDEFAAAPRLPCPGPRAAPSSRQARPDF
ncbi:MAG: tRNA-dihydrouridine synthase [Chloroflexi bacterium]|nr:tRNA-dihydrouridine synthase [Chloroflexota bacterium]